MDDTIFAVATGAGRAAICIVRVSGPFARDVLRRLAGRVPPARQATLARLRDPANGETLDQALVLFFEAARSELGEDGAELHLHGGRAVVAAVLAALAAMPGLRAAEPGEFARRAFRNGRIDLAQLEGLADLIDAETEWQRRQAQRQLSGAMRDATAPWRATLVEAAAQVETAIDFAEDVELDATVRGDVLALVAPVRAGLRLELARAHAAERLREGVQVVIAGPPNVGKSSLLNALARREAAIVSAVPGTTRDVIEVHLDLDGCPLTLIDTAGLREASDPVERIGVGMAHDRAAAADLVLWLGDDDYHGPTPAWRIAAKADLRPVSPEAKPDGSLPVSATTGFNLDVLRGRLASFAATIAQGGATALVARQRHRLAFTEALRALDALEAEPAMPIELVAEQLRVARHALARLFGTVDVEDILGDIFSRFCIGK